MKIKTFVLCSPKIWDKNGDYGHRLEVITIFLSSLDF